MMNRIDQKFKSLKAKNKSAFISFITAGYPSLNVTEKLVYEFEKQGVDIIELGVPFSDPLADGSVIQESSKISLRKGTDVIKIFSKVKKIRKVSQIPICLMTYYNPIFNIGEEKFIRMAKDSGVDGIIVPDLPLEEADRFIKTAKKYSIHIILFISPTSSIQRIRKVADIASGFIYYVSLTGVTGVRGGLSCDLKKRIQLIKRHTQKPICVGFGVSTKKQVKKLSLIADGVIIGSAIILKIKANINKSENLIVNKTASFIKRLK